MMTTETKVLIGVLVATVAIIAGGAFFAGNNDGSTTTQTAGDPDRLVRDDSPVRGAADATVTVVEFGDFQCPACGAAHTVVQQVKDQYADQPVRFVFRQYPLTHIHEFAQKAAEASLAAQAQGKFWEYHDMLFENQTALEREDLIGYAEALELDVERFTQELDDGTHAGIVTQGLSDGTAVGVRGTPSFYVNGTKLSDFSIQSFTTAIDAALGQGV